jgi:hypothetical protein
MEFLKFLIKAKIQAYASGGEGGETRLSDGSKELTFAEGEFSYRDRYFGFNPFAGEEVVWQNGQACWTMNYYGLVSDPDAPAGEIYHFLQKAMRQVQEERPFRGPAFFQEGDFEYRDESRGTWEQYIGIERIFYRGKEVYRLDYHGGMLK